MDTNKFFSFSRIAMVMKKLPTADAAGSFYRAS